MTQQQLLELLEKRWFTPVPVDIAKDAVDNEIFERTYLKPIRLK
jgi:hypothetical protein